MTNCTPRRIIVRDEEQIVAMHEPRNGVVRAAFAGWCALGSALACTSEDETVALGSVSRAAESEPTPPRIGPNSSCEIRKAAMEGPRVYHASVRVGVHGVLACGGERSASEPISSCELYDVAQRRWRRSPQELPFAMRFPQLFWLDREERLLLVGGQLEQGANSVSAWMAQGDIWHPENMAARYGHASVRLDDGSLLVAGGWDNSVLVRPQWRDLSGVWRDLPLPAGYEAALSSFQGTATVLKDGKSVLLAGGEKGDSASRDAYVYRAGQVFEVPMPESRALHTATLLPDGSVLVVGGEDAKGQPVLIARKFVPGDTGGEWREAGRLSRPLWAHAAAPIGRDYVALVGGRTTQDDRVTQEELQKGVQIYNSALLQEPELNGFVSVTPLCTPRTDFTLEALGPNELLAVGGSSLPAIDEPSSEVISLSPLGAPCAGAEECVSGVCSPEGNCCDRPCADPCSSCGESGREGTCSPISGPARHGGACDRHLLCREGACLTSCRSEIDCEQGHYCEFGRCSPRKPLGAECATSAECRAGTSCAPDGVCCDSLCNGPCETCTASGQCQILAEGSAPRTTHPSCTLPGHHARCAPECDGRTGQSCSLPKSDCQSDSCADDRAFRRWSCTPEGACLPQEEQGCGSYHCSADGERCLTRCASDQECADGFQCRSETCQPRPQCSPDEKFSEAPQEEPRDCGGYWCLKGTGECGNSCQVSKEHCRWGFTCEPRTHRCVPVAAHTVIVSGCSAAPARGAESPWVLGAILGGAGCVTLRRRFRKRASRGSVFPG